jgi:hypothetical protein
MKTHDGTIGRLTRDLPACSAVTQPTAPPRAGIQNVLSYENSVLARFWTIYFHIPDLFDIKHTDHFRWGLGELLLDRGALL